MTTISKIFNAVKTKPDLLIKLESGMFKVFTHCTTPNSMEAIDDVMDCLTLVLHQTGTISEESWSIIPQLLKIVVGGPDEEEGGFGYEYFTVMETYFKNIFRLDQREVFTRMSGDITYFDLILKSMGRILEISKTSYADGTATIAVNIMTSMLENLKGCIDSYIPHILKIVVEEITRDGVTPAYVKTLLKCVMASFYNNPDITLQVIGELNAFESTLEACFGNIEQYKDLSAMKHFIYGATELFKLTKETLPEVVITKVVESLLKIIQKYSTESTKAAKETAKDDGNNSDIEDDYYDYNEGEDDDYDGAFDDDYVPAESNSNLYQGKFDELPAPLHFRITLKQLSESNPDVYNGIIQLISGDQQTMLEAAFKSAEESG